MASVDFLVEDEQSLEKIRLVVAQCLDVSVARVAVIRDLAEYPAAGAYYAVCKVIPLTQGLKQLITVDWPAATPNAFIECLAKHFGSACVVPTNDHDPYKMEYVSPDGLRKQVALDTKLLDEHGVYQIVE